MATEIKSPLDTHWPAGVRLPIVLTFEHQSGEGTPLRPGDRPNALMGGQIEYGARRGIWNILELLDSLGVKATFFVTGVTAEKFPATVQAAQAAGHEIAGMGYSFERIRAASREREQSVVRRTVKALGEACGTRILGWRCPDYRISPQTLDILSTEGFAWDSSLLNDDLPYLMDCEGGTLLEIPFTTSTADKSFIAFPYPMRGGPDGLANAWTYEFDVLHREAQDARRFMIISMQTWATGRPTPLRTLKHFIQHVMTYNDVEITRCDRLAAWCTDPNSQH